MPISLIAAFLGGVLSLLSPCSAMVLPSFFAVGFKRKRRILTATLIFSAGLLLVLIPLGLGAFGVGQLLSFYRKPMSLLIGTLLAFAGTMMIFGKHLPFPNVADRLLSKKRSAGYSSAFSLGLVAGLGSSACVGPIMGAIATLALAAQNPTGALVLMFTYSLGLILPLFGMVLAYDKFGWAERKLFRGKTISLGRLKIHSTNLLSGLLLLFIAYIFIRFQGSLGLSSIFTKTGILEAYFNLQYKLFNL